MRNLELLARMIDTHGLESSPYEVFLGKLQVYLTTQLENKNVLVEMFNKSGQLDAMIECPDCGTHTLLGFKKCNFCGCELLEIEATEELAEAPVAKAIKEDIKKATKKAVKAPTKVVAEIEEVPVKEELLTQDEVEANTPISNTDEASLDDVTEEEDKVMKMRLPNLIRIVAKYGLKDSHGINPNDEKKYSGRKIKVLRNDICDALFGEIEEAHVEVVEAPVEKAKKEVKKSPKKSPKKEVKKEVKEVVEAPVEEEETVEESTQYTKSGDLPANGEDLPPLPERDEIFAMTREELVQLNKDEELGIKVNRFRKLEALREEVDKVIEELLDEEDGGSEGEASAEPVTKEVQGDDSDEAFELDDLDDVQLDDDLELD